MEKTCRCGCWKRKLRVEGDADSELTRELGIWPGPSQGWKDQVKPSIDVFLSNGSDIDVDQLLYDLHAYTTRNRGRWSAWMRELLKEEKVRFDKAIKQINRLLVTVIGRKDEVSLIQSVVQHDGMPSLEEQFGAVFPPHGDIESAFSTLSIFVKHLEARSAYVSSQLQSDPYDTNWEDHLEIANWRDKIRAATGNRYRIQFLCDLVLAAETASFGAELKLNRDGDSILPSSVDKLLDRTLEAKALADSWQDSEPQDISI